MEWEVGQIVSFNHTNFLISLLGFHCQFSSVTNLFRRSSYPVDAIIVSQNKYNRVAFKMVSLRVLRIKIVYTRPVRRSYILGNIMVMCDSYCSLLHQQLRKKLFLGNVAGMDHARTGNVSETAFLLYEK